MADEPAVTPETPPGEERPSWLLDRFESPEAQAQAYAESQAEMNRMRSQMEQERQSFTSALEGMQQQAPAPPQFGNGQQAFDPALSAYTQAWEAGDAQGMLAAQAAYVQAPVIDAVGRLIDEKLSAITPAVQEAQAQARQQNIMLAEGLVERELGAERYNAIKGRVSEIVASDPLRWLPAGQSSETYKTAIIDVVKLAEHDSLQRQVVELQQERADKLAAQTLSGGYNRPQGNPDADKAEFERIKNTKTGSFQELMDSARRQA